MFNPKFITVNDVDVCSDLINKPHEDYPDRVQSTIEMIEYGLAHLNNIAESDCKAFHSHIMHDLSYDKGCWRTRDVTVAGNATTTPFMIAGEIQEQRLFPMDYITMDTSDIIRWYRAFQIIHPFVDGNGRVGGVIVAIASFNGRSMLAPCQ